MLGRELKQALKSGRRVYGIGIEGYNQPRWPSFFADLGLDFVFIDNEHTPLDRETLAWAAQLYAANRIAPLLRIPEVSPTLAAMALNSGAHGVIVPYVETVEQVKSLVGAVKYRPLKGAALERVMDNCRFPSDDTATYLTACNLDALLVIMIESSAGVDNLEHLLAVGGVDVVLIGPHDFSVSHGVPEQYDHPLFVERAKQVITICRAHDIGVGIHYNNGSIERAVEWAQWGTNFICQRTDTFFIAQGIRSELQHLRQALGTAMTSNTEVYIARIDGTEAEQK